MGFDEGHAITVSAAHIDAVLNGTVFRHDDQKSFDAWVASHKSLIVAPLKAPAVQALDRLLANSELNDLWSETEEHAKWRAIRLSLRDRLAKD